MTRLQYRRSAAWLTLSLFAALPAAEAQQRPVRPAGNPAGVARPGAAPAASSQLPPSPSGNVPPAPGPAQQGGPAQPNGQARLPRPAEQPDLVITPLHPDLLKVMQTWERESAKVKSLHGHHSRFVYNKVFMTEKRAEGKFYYENPDLGRIDMEGCKINPKEVSKRLDPDGNPFKIEADKQERWVCTGQEVIQINDTEKTVEAFPLPKEVQGQNIINGPLPFLFGMKVEEAQKRFRLTLIGENEVIAKIEAVPRTQMDAANYSKATIMLNKQTYLPHAVQLIDPAGQLETVYLFKEMEVNNAGIKAKLGSLFGGNPFKPNLTGYKTILPPAVDSSGQILPASTTQPAAKPAARTATQQNGVDNRPLPRTATR